MYKHLLGSLTYLRLSVTIAFPYLVINILILFFLLLL